jgi:hypothetical protein
MVAKAGSSVGELVDTAAEGVLTAALERLDDDRSNGAVVGELGEVLVGQVSGSLQLIVADQRDDLDALSMASAPDEERLVVSWNVHRQIIERRPVRSLARRCPPFR